MIDMAVSLTMWTGRTSLFAERARMVGQGVDQCRGNILSEVIDQFAQQCGVIGKRPLASCREKGPHRRGGIMTLQGLDHVDNIRICSGPGRGLVPGVGVIGFMLHRIGHRYFLAKRDATTILRKPPPPEGPMRGHGGYTTGCRRSMQVSSYKGFSVKSNPLFLYKSFHINGLMEKSSQNLS